jgi:hypothetical protein
MPIKLKRDTSKDTPYKPQFVGPIFMGAGDGTHEECMRAHELLDNIFEVISGLQQPQPITEEDDPNERAAGHRELSIMIEDLYRAIAYKI